jgi:hypothetical protein
MSKPLCTSCVATCDTADGLIALPVTHRPGQLIVRVDIRHEAHCRYLARVSPGTMPWQQVLGRPVTTCDGCVPTAWWDKLGNVIRTEFYHADDCSARAASELAAESSR